MYRELIWLTTPVHVFLCGMNLGEPFTVPNIDGEYVRGEYTLAVEQFSLNPTDELQIVRLNEPTDRFPENPVFETINYKDLWLLTRECELNQGIANIGADHEMVDESHFLSQRIQSNPF